MPKQIPRSWVLPVPSKDGYALVGNRDGLHYLKEQIEVALQGEEARIASGKFEWSVIRCEETYPWAMDRPKRRIRELFALLVVGTVVATIMFIFAAGIYQINQWW